MKTRLGLILGMVAGLLHAREWKSADGGKTVEAVFAGLRGDMLALRLGGKPSVFPLAAFAPEDQQFAKNAQAIAETAAKLGPQSFELAHPVEDGSGWICRLALQTDPKAGGPKLFTGETFFLACKDATSHHQGARIENQVLYGAGGRTYHPLDGDPSMVRAYALDVEHATQVWMEVMSASGGDVGKQVPNVVEPDVETAVRHGFGVVIGRGGLVAIDPEIIKKGFTSLVIHHDGKDYPATPFSPKDKEGADIQMPDVQLVSCAVPLQPARIGTKKAVEVGQNVFAISYELNSSKKGFHSKAIVTRGIVSRFGTGGNFQHDARLAPENPGGYLVSEKGDVAGFFFQTQTSGLSAKKGRPDAQPAAEGLGSCVSTQAISKLLEKIPGQSELRSGATTGDMEADGKALLASSVLVLATFEISKPRKISPSKAGAPAAAMPPGTAPAAAGWSLSKSGIRHNSKCQYFNARLPCQATEGRACKVCGG